MIEITYDRRYYSVTVKGHAGAAEPGHDIVCAGVSALVYALCTRGSIRFHAQCDNLTGGDDFVRCYPRQGEEALCREMLETGMTGLRAIARTYPEYVTVREAV